MDMYRRNRRETVDAITRRRAQEKAEQDKLREEKLKIRAEAKKKAGHLKTMAAVATV